MIHFDSPQNPPKDDLHFLGLYDDIKDNDMDDPGQRTEGIWNDSDSPENQICLAGEESFIVLEDIGTSDPTGLQVKIELAEIDCNDYYTVEGVRPFSYCVCPSINGKYTLRYTLYLVGKWTVDIFDKNQSLLPRPYIVQVDAGAEVDPELCSVRGLGIGRVTNTGPSYFYLNACDKYGNVMSEGGADVVVIIISSVRVEGVILDNGEGFYEATYRLLLETSSNDRECPLWINRLPLQKYRKEELWYRTQEQEGWNRGCFELKSGQLSCIGQEELTLVLKGSLVSGPATFVSNGDQKGPPDGFHFHIASSKLPSNVLYFIAENRNSSKQWVLLLAICSKPDYEETSQVNHLALPGSPGFKGIEIHLKVNGEPIPGSPWKPLPDLKDTSEKSMLEQHPDSHLEITEDVLSLPLEMNASRSACHYGVLHKKSSTGEIYSKRYFVLKGHGATARLLYFLDYLKDPTVLPDLKDRAKGIIYLQGSEVWAEVPFTSEDETKVFPFIIHTRTGLRYSLYASTEDERLTWIAAIEQVISKSTFVHLPTSRSPEASFSSPETCLSFSVQDAAEIVHRPSISPKAPVNQMYAAPGKKDVQFSFADLPIPSERSKDVPSSKPIITFKESQQRSSHEMSHPGADVFGDLPYRREKRKETKFKAEKEVQRPRRSSRKTKTVGERPEWKRVTAKDRVLAPTPRYEIVNRLTKELNSTSSKPSESQEKRSNNMSNETSRTVLRKKLSSREIKEPKKTEYGNIYSCLLEGMGRETESETFSSLPATTPTHKNKKLEPEMSSSMEVKAPLSPLLKKLIEGQIPPPPPSSERHNRIASLDLIGAKLPQHPGLNSNIYCEKETQTYSEPSSVTGSLEEPEGKTPSLGQCERKDDRSQESIKDSSPNVKPIEPPIKPKAMKKRVPSYAKPIHRNINHCHTFPKASKTIKKAQSSKPSASFGTMTRSVSGKRGNIGEVKLKSSPTKYVTPDASPRRERWKKAPFRQSPGGGPSFFDLYSNVAEQQPENLGNVTTGCKTIRSKVPAALGQCDEDTTTRELGVAEAECRRLLDWLTDLRMEHYIPNFSEQGLTNLASLELLNTHDLAEIGISNEHRGPLMSAIQIFSARTREWTDTALHQNSAEQTFSIDPCYDLASNHPPPSPNDILAAFDACDRSLLFTLWEYFLPLEARKPGHPIHGLASSLEFYLQVYVVVHSLLQEDSIEVASSMEEFRNYIEERASKLPLANTKAFVAYAGICLVPQPRMHPSYQFLFEVSWRSCLRERLRVFLEAIGTQRLCPRASLPLAASYLQNKNVNWLSGTSNRVGMGPPKLNKPSTFFAEVGKKNHQSLTSGSTEGPQDRMADIQNKALKIDIEDPPFPSDPFPVSHEYHSSDSYNAGFLSPDKVYYQAEGNRSPTASGMQEPPALQGFSRANPRRPSRDPPLPPQG